MNEETQSSTQALNIIFPVGVILHDSPQTQIVIKSIGKWEEIITYKDKTMLQWDSSITSWVVSDEKYSEVYYKRVL